MPRRSYTRSEKAEAVGLAVVHGVTEAERRTGIAKQRVSEWLRDFDPGGQLRTKSREAVADEMWATIQVGIREVAKGIIGDAPLRDKVIALGVLYDKHALLTGGATGRTETRDISGTLSDADLVAIVREAERIASGGRVAEAAAGAAEGEGL